jgi:hypothetical protein
MNTYLLFDCGHGMTVTEAVLRPVFNELTYNLESFNPAFTSCLLMVGWVG